MEADFSGYVTKAGLKCSDGRTIMPDAFRHQDKMVVPLVWQHGHSSPENVLGHVQLEARNDGVYGYGFFNDTKQGENASKLVIHEDVKALSIYANQLIEKSKQVLHGAIKEVSLCLSGANPGAFIDYVRIAHADGEIETLEDEAIIFTGLPLEHENLETEDELSGASVSHASSSADNLTVQDVYDSLTEQQKEVVHYMIGAALEAATSSTSHSDLSPDASMEEVFETLSDEQRAAVESLIHSAVEEAGAAAHSGDNQEGNEMTHNVFEGNGTKDQGPTLTHDQLSTIVEDAKKIGSFKEAILAHAGEYGITDIDVLFPDAQAVTTSPDFISRRTEWVASVLGAAKHSPFSRIKSTAADITAEEARAKGYVKGNLKKDEIIKLLKRVTTPTTVYKKQKLDRDDVVDITDLDVVAWLKAEMRLMLDEEIARAALVGDGREPDDPDKIDEEKIRPIAWDDEMYAHSINVPSNTTAAGYVESILRARKYYKGTGTPTLYTTDDILTDMILLVDKMGRRLYNTETELAAALRVDKIVTVEVMDDVADVIAIIVNMADYTFGADRGGQIGMFDDFDIDYNQYKYLIESRVSGCLTKPKSALVLKQDTGTTVIPTAPAFDPATNTITVPTIVGVSYFNVTDPLNEVEMADGSNVVITETTDVEARADAGYEFPHNTDTDWTYAFTG